MAALMVACMAAMAAGDKIGLKGVCSRGRCLGHKQNLILHKGLRESLIHKREFKIAAQEIKGETEKEDIKPVKIIQTPKPVRKVLTDSTKFLTGTQGSILRNSILICSGVKLLSDGKYLEAAYALGLVPVLQQVLDRTDIGSWNALASLLHRSSGVFMLALGPILATYFMLSGEASLPGIFVYPVLLAALINPITGVLLVNKNLAKADMSLLRQFATGYQGAVAAACHGLLLYTLPDSKPLAVAYLLFTLYHFVYAWGDSFIHAFRLAQLNGKPATDDYDESIKLDTLPGGLRFPSDVWEMWRRAPQTPGAGTPYENILWRALIYNQGEKEDKWTAAPSTLATTAVAWSVSIPATTYFLVALSYVIHGSEAVQGYVNGLDYNFQGILATMSLLASSQNNLGVFLVSLILHKKMEVPVVWAVYGSSWALFIAYVCSFIGNHPHYLEDYLRFLNPISNI